jgi:hypothetical protein
MKTFTLLSLLLTLSGLSWAKSSNHGQFAQGSSMESCKNDTCSDCQRKCEQALKLEDLRRDKVIEPPRKAPQKGGSKTGSEA